MTTAAREQEPRRGGFVPPPYPYDRLDELKALAAATPGGLVDCSVGTPIDPPPDAVLEALGSSGSERGYPSSAGSLGLRAAAAAWFERTFGVAVEPSALAACVGTKEFVASTPAYLALRDPTRDTVLYPAVSYPTYEMGAILAGCRAVAVPPATPDGSGLDLGAIDPDDAARALLVWANSPSNPTGGLCDLAAVAAWGRAHDVPVFSDECYAAFTWERGPQTVLSTGPDGAVAVHSLSKTFNMAGVRVGFFAGDTELVTYLRDVRQHAGLMVPGPAQAAGIAALGDTTAQDAQRARYAARLALLADALAKAGIPAPMPAGGFYLWVPVPEPWADGWALAHDLARTTGMLVSPGEFYGSAGSRFVRIAVVQPDDRLAHVAGLLRAGALGDA
jgi:aspartate/methionine/tyrosine aminotransferase